MPPPPSPVLLPLFDFCGPENGELTKDVRDLEKVLNAGLGDSKVLPGHLALTQQRGEAWAARVIHGLPANKYRRPYLEVLIRDAYAVQPVDRWVIKPVGDMCCNWRILPAAVKAAFACRNPNFLRGLADLSRDYSFEKTAGALARAVAMPVGDDNGDGDGSSQSRASQSMMYCNVKQAEQILRQESWGTRAPYKREISVADIEVVESQLRIDTRGSGDAAPTYSNDDWSPGEMRDPRREMHVSPFADRFKTEPVEELPAVGPDASGHASSSTTSASTSPQLSSPPTSYYREIAPAPASRSGSPSTPRPRLPSLASWSPIHQSPPYAAELEAGPGPTLTTIRLANPTPQPPLLPKPRALTILSQPNSTDDQHPGPPQSWPSANRAMGPGYTRATAADDRLDQARTHFAHAVALAEQRAVNLELMMNEICALKLGAGRLLVDLRDLTLPVSRAFTTQVLGLLASGDRDWLEALQAEKAETERAAARASGPGARCYIPAARGKEASRGCCCRGALEKVPVG
ncbi:hypothetical protein B0T22DRAFT_508958 [Podospora appendiculata]|uniref:Uncharacterized protein n=1 Tax=Podospora appendiculata TaxID=314037 RepID=A0AAE1CID8_9PEZI|nr:hypothetical protein B0T22DRAFT_508958 [Podospora appendiculata]